MNTHTPRPVVTHIARFGRRKVFMTALAIMITGCSGEATEVQIDAGTAPSGAWSAWVYDSLTSGVCFEVRPSGHDPERICDLDAGNTGIWRPDSNEGDVEFVTGTTAEANVSQAVVTLDDGQQIKADVEEAIEVSPLRFFVIAIPAGAQARQLDLLDVDGTVLNSQPLG